MRSRSEVERIIKNVLKNDGYPDADSYSRQKIIRILDSCFEEVARQTFAWPHDRNLAYQMAKAHMLEVFHLSEDEYDSFLLGY